MTDQRLWTWPWLIATTLAKSVLAAVICLGLWGAVPAAVGWLPTTVSSGSMLPRLHVGDVAVSRPLGAAQMPNIGNVLLFEDPDHAGRLRMHRFIRISDDGRLITRGDANQSDDSSPVALTAVRGIATLRVPWVALPVIWVREHAWLPLGLSLLVILGLTALAGQGRKFGFADPPAGTPGPDDPPVDDPPATDGDLVPERIDDADVVADDDRQPAVTSRIGGAATSVLRATLRRGRSIGIVTVAVQLSLVGVADARFSDTSATANTLAAADYFSCANAVAAATPYFWYRMDETSSLATTAADSSGGARTGVYGLLGKTAGATRACTRDSGRAMTFNGSTGYLSSPLVTGTLPNTFTFAIWFKTTTTRGGKLIGWGNTQSGASTVYDRHIYMTNSGKIIFGLYPGTPKTVVSAASFNDGDWHQAVATLSPAGMRLYLDGELAGVDASVTAGESSTSGYVRIAYDNLDSWPSVPTSRFFAGTLDDAAVYATALSAAQVEAQYEAGI